jgi:hypothetical protein
MIIAPSSIIIIRGVHSRFAKTRLKTGSTNHASVITVHLPVGTVPGFLNGSTEPSVNRPNNNDHDTI